jgi:hypothetical protein
MSKKYIYIDVDGFETEALAYESTDFTAVGGAGNENAPALLNASGQFDASMIDFGAIDHSGLSGLLDDDHTQYILVDGSRAFTGNQSAGGFLITNLPAPVAANDAVRKAYVDAVAVGLRVHGNVAVATTGNITLSGEQTIDGVLTSASRVLVKDQTDPKENGIYLSGAGAWARAEDMDNSPIGEIYNGEYIPKVLGGVANIDLPFVITSVGTGTDGLHTVGVDDIVFDVFTSPSQLQAGNGINFNGNIVEIDLADVDPGLYFDGNNDLGIDWSVSYNDAKAIKASDLSSTANGKGASIIGVEDANSYFTATNQEGVNNELFEAIAGFGVEYTVGAGGVAIGDLVYISSDNTVTKYGTITAGERVPGIALTTEIAASTVKVLSNDTLVLGVLTALGVSAGDIIYWDGTGLVSSIPSGAGTYVYQAGIAKNSDDLHVEVEFRKKNA